MSDFFRPYLERAYQTTGALTTTEQIAVIDRLADETRQGAVPISSDSRLTLQSDDPIVTAVREGVSLSIGHDISAPNTPTASDAQKQKSMRMGIIMLATIPFLGLVLYLLTFLSPDDEPAQEEVTSTPVAMVFTSTISGPTPYPTYTPYPTLPPPPTFTPAPPPTSIPTIESSETPSVAMTNTIITDTPLSVSIAGKTFSLKIAQLGPTWTPRGAEWWPSTIIRPVIALPINELSPTEAIAAIGSEIILRTQQRITTYVVSSISSVETGQTDLMQSNTPSIVMILYGETTKWAVIGEESGKLVTNDVVTTSTGDIGTITACQQTANQLVCTLETTLDPTALRITDLSWIEFDLHSTLITQEKDDQGLYHLQLAGIVNADQSVGTPVIFYAESDLYQIVPAHLIER